MPPACLVTASEVLAPSEAANGRGSAGGGGGGVMGDDAALTVDDSETTTAPAGRSVSARAALPLATGAAIEADGGERGAGCDTAHERRSTSPVQAAAAGSVLVVERHDDPPAPWAGDGGEAEQCGVRGHIVRPAGALAPVTENERRGQEGVGSGGGGGGSNAAAVPSYSREVRPNIYSFRFSCGRTGFPSSSSTSCDTHLLVLLLLLLLPLSLCRPAWAWA